MSIKEKLIEFFVKRQINKESNKPMIEKIRSAWKWTENKKSAFFGIASVAAAIAYVLGYIDKEQLDKVLLVTGSGYAYSIADKGSRIVKLLKETKVIEESKKSG